MSSSTCPNCGAAVAADSRFCSECGTPAPGPEGIETRLRTYWSPPDLGLLAGIVVTAAGVVLLGAKIWLWAVVALVLGTAIVALRLAAGRRAAGGALTRVAAQRRVVGARSRGQLELFRLRRELAELHAERSRSYQELGRATHERDEAAAARATAQADDVAARIGAKEAEIDVLLRAMEHRVRQAQAEVTPTSRLEAPPEPARVPEPFPPPDEGTPPEPARVPEPFPQPAPERAPDEPVPPPEPPPAPETAERRPSRTANT
ncbi:MAG TPA: zinc-ribbon domain-containing protein [Gaiellaceae bacterium]|nr:zinc-ribbon domain-containing protein [Gaiellaceae bacterium]